MHIYWSSLVIQLVAFGILYYLLSRYALGPILSIMEERKAKVLEDLAQAETSRKEAEAAVASQTAALQQARTEAHGIIEQAKSTSAKQADEIVQAAKAEANRVKEEAVQDIKSETNKAIAALRTEVGGLSVQIASKIIEKQIDEKSQEQLVDNYLKEVGNR